MNDPQHSSEEILTTEISDDTLFDFAVVAVGFEDTDVLVDVAAGRRDFNDADKQEMSITTISANVNGNLWLTHGKNEQDCHYTFRPKRQPYLQNRR